MSSIKELGCVGGSLFQPGRSKLILDLSDTYRNISRHELNPPYNTDELVSSGISRSITERRLSEADHDYTRPYWNPHTPYKLTDMLASSVQFFDEHRQPIPKTTLVPAADVRSYRDFVMESDHKLSIPEQLNGLLDITDDNLVGAANLGFLASRLYARGGDLRAYADVFKPSDLDEWNKHIMQFDTGDEGVNDGPGDTYYFWTHFFIASSAVAFSTPASKAMRQVFKAGTPVMRTVRNAVGSWTVSDHKKASLMGRELGYTSMRRVLSDELTGTFT